MFEAMQRPNWKSVDFRFKDFFGTQPLKNCETNHLLSF